MDLVSDSTSIPRDIYLDLCTPDPFSNEIPHPDCDGLLRIECGATSNQGEIVAISNLSCTSHRKCSVDDSEEVSSASSHRKQSVFIAIGSALWAILKYST